MLDMLNKLQDSVVSIGKVNVVNTTPHVIRMVNEDLSLDVTVPASGVLINAETVEEPVESGIEGVKFLSTKFIPDTDTMDALKAFKAANPDVIIIGSMIAMNAYPGLVVAMVPHPDYKRVAPADKRMLIDTYSVSK